MVEQDPVLAAGDRPAQHVELQLRIEGQRREEPGSVAALEQVEAAAGGVGAQVDVRTPSLGVLDVVLGEGAVARQAPGRRMRPGGATAEHQRSPEWLSWASS